METRRTHYIALDIDHTVVAGHIHNTIANYKQALEREIDQIKKDIEEKDGYESEESLRTKIEEMNKPIVDKIFELEKSASPDSKAAIRLQEEDLLNTSEEFIRQEVEDAKKLLPQYKAKLREAEQRLDAITNDPKAQYELIKHLEPIGNVIDWQTMWQDARAAGFEIAGLSYGSFPGATAIWLQQKLGFETEIVPHNRDQEPIDLDPNKMTLISYLPVFEDQRKYGKNKHIIQLLKAKDDISEEDVKKLLSSTSYTEGNDKPEITTRLCLVDDSQKNVQCANDKGFATILAKPRNDAHLEALRNHIKNNDPQHLARHQILNTATDAIPTIGSPGTSIFSDSKKSSGKTARETQTQDPGPKSKN